MLMLDTHIAVALYQGRTAGLSRKALAAIDHEPLTVSPVAHADLREAALITLDQRIHQHYSRALD